MKWEKYGVDIEVVQGDIADQGDMAAVVNAANAELQTGGGVAGAIHRAAGPALAEAGEKYAPIEPGEAVVTPAFQLPNEKVIHCLGPVYGQDTPSDELLMQCYQNSLKAAEEAGIESIAFPAISTGAFGYPFDEAMEVAVNTVIGELKGLQHVKYIRFVLFSEREKKKYTAYLTEAIT